MSHLACEQLISIAAMVTFVAAKSLGCSHSTIYRRVRDNEVLQEIIEDEREAFTDHVESKLHEKIEEGNMTAIIFYLKTQAKHRGYVERPEPGFEYDNTETVITMHLGDKVLKQPPGAGTERT